jgi:hypothetical protein
VLGPQISKAAWTVEEDLGIVLGQREEGNEWAHLAREKLPGR